MIATVLKNISNSGNQLFPPKGMALSWRYFLDAATSSLPLQSYVATVWVQKESTCP